MQLSASARNALARQAGSLNEKRLFAGFDAHGTASGPAGRCADAARLLADCGLVCHVVGAAEPAEPNEAFSAFTSAFGARTLPSTTALSAIDYDACLRATGEGKFLDLLSRADLFYLSGWGYLPKFGSLLADLLERGFAMLGDLNPRTFLLDFSHTGKARAFELASLLDSARKYRSRGSVCAHFNAAEAAMAGKLIGFRSSDEEPATAEALTPLAHQLRQNLEAAHVTIEGADFAVAADRYEVVSRSVDMPLPDSDNRSGATFAATYGLAAMLGLPLRDALETAAAAKHLQAVHQSLPNLDDLLLG